MNGRARIPARFLFDGRSATLTRSSGWERYARELGTAVRRHGQVDVWAPTVERPVARVASDLFTAPMAARRYDVVHFPTFPPVPWARARKAVVYTLHDLVWWTYPETASRGGRHYYRRLAKSAIGRCHVVTPSRVVAEDCISFGIPEDRVTPVPLGLSLPAPSTKPPRDKPYLLSVGTLEPRKNLPRLVQAFAAAGVAKDMDLVLVGRSGWGEQPAPGVVHLEGVSDSELATLYRHAVAVVQPSLYEGFGLPLAEALGAGGRVLCSDIPVFREVCGPWATYFDPADIDVLSKLLRDLMVRAPEAPSKARAAWASQFSWEVAAQQLVSLYERLALKA